MRQPLFRHALIFVGLCICLVKTNDKSRLLSGSGILMKDTLVDSLIDLLYSNLDCISLVGCIALNSGVSLLDSGLEC